MDRLAEIQARCDVAKARGIGGPVIADLSYILTEVRALESENAALRKALDEERTISTGLLNAYTDANRRVRAIAQTDERKAEIK